ncbi:MAG: hypothetical protein IJU31_06820 [Synergistaceae bacterium]|nr:hypothetical protein [Synergistaceae bacterium]
MSDFMKGPWIAVESPHVVVSEDRRMMIAEIKGLGYLTGMCKGIPALPMKDAFKVLDANTRLIAAAPEMYELLKNTAFYLEEVNKLKPLPSELMDYAKRIAELLARIDGKENAQ